MGKRLWKSVLDGFWKRPMFSVGLAAACILLFRFWPVIREFTDSHPVIRIILSAEWAISRYGQGEKFFKLSHKGFFWFLIVKNICLWIFWVGIFFIISPRIARQQDVRKIFRYFTLENHQKNFLSRGLIRLVLRGTEHRVLGRLVSGACYFAFSFVSHGDIPAIGVAIGFKQWWAVFLVLAAMLSKITFWSHFYLHFP